MAKILGLQPRTAAIVGGGVLVAAGGYFWWRNRQSQAAAASSAGTSSTGCTDSSGNSVPCPDTSGVDYSGELSVIQTELESLLAQQAGDTDTSTSGGGTTTTTAGKVTVPKVTGLTVAAANEAIHDVGLVPGAHSTEAGVVNGQTPLPGAKVAAGSKVDLSVAAREQGGGNPPSPPGGGPGAGRPEEITGLHVTSVSATGFRVRWRKPAGTMSYRWTVTYQGKRVHAGSTPGTAAASVQGLVRDRTYGFHVQACNARGCGAAASIDVKTKA